MERSRVWVAVALLIVLFAGVMPSGAASTECGSKLSSVPVGTGTHLIDNPSLEGVNHVDLPIPSCSEGRFSFGSGTAPGVNAQKFCVDGFIRVYAPPGTFDNSFLVLWLQDDGQGCAATVDPPLLPQLP